MWWSVGSSTTELSNLDRFLHRVTPSPPSRSLSPSCASGINSLWQPAGEEMIEYFRLGDLWDCYKEWSAYGNETQVQLNNGETVKQYYIPYLSAIQISTDKSTAVFSRSPRDEVESESDSSSSDSGNNNSSKTWDGVSEDSGSDQDEKLGHLYMQYFETCSPCWRVPLTDKINELARNHPGLMTLRSVDVSPASWMAVAWYPIYHIPSREYEKDLSTCFLTYHTLSSCFQDNIESRYTSSSSSSSSSIPLTPFGLATYKMQGDLWTKPRTSDYQQMVYLHSAADSWLKQLNTHHHDYDFFTSHSTNTFAFNTFSASPSSSE